MNADLEMIEALLAHMQQNPGSVGSGAGQMYEDIHDDDDDEYDDDEDDDDDEDYYGGGGGAGGGGGGDQHNINMFQNPFSGSGGGGEGGGDADAGAVSLLQGLLGMNGAGMGDMGLPGMGGGVMGSSMDGNAGGFDVSSFIPNMTANVGAALAGAFGAASSGIMDGLAGQGGGATIHEYDEDEELTEGSESEDEEDEDEDEDDEEESDDDHRHGVMPNGSQMAAMVAMGGMAAGGGIAAMAAMMNQQQRQSPQQQLYAPHPQMSQQQYMMQSPQASQPSMYSSSPLNPVPTSAMGSGQPHLQQQQSSMMSNFAAVAVATAAAAMHLPSASSPAPTSSASSMLSPQCIPSAALSPPMSISSNLGGGTMSRVDPLAALAMGGAAAVMGGAVLGKVVSTLSNNSGGGTALVKPDHLNSTMPPPMMHKSMDELNKLSDSTSFMRISGMPMPPHSQAMQAAYSQQHLAQMHHPGGPVGKPNMMYPGQFMMPGMLIRPPMASGTMMPPHSAAAMAAVAAAAAASNANGNRNDGDKTSLDRESVPCSETSGGGKSDTESTTKKTPSPTLVGPGRVSPDSSSGSSSSGSDRGHVKNATSFASLSDLPSATESLRDSDTDQHVENMQQIHRRLCAMEHEPIPRGNGIMLPGPVPLLIETPGYGWSSLVGHENAKDALKNLFQGKKFPEVFDSQGSCRGVLLFGPSGAGKTSLARSLAYEAGGAKLIACTPSFILNRNVPPQSAAMLIRQMFDHARVHRPCVMLMDEIEMLALPELTEAGRWAKAELMAQVRGETTMKPAYPQGPNSKSINDHLMLVATTCSPWVLPEELRRLFAYNIHIKLPAEKQREELFRMFLNTYANNVTSDQYKCLISKSEG